MARLVLHHEAQGAELGSSFLAAFQSLLSRYCGQEQICVGTPIAGRNRAEIWREVLGLDRVGRKALPEPRPRVHAAR